MSEMSIIKNKIAFPTKLGRFMGLILICGTPWLLEIILEEFGYYTHIWIALVVWMPFIILAAIYIYFWIKSDNENKEGRGILEILRECNRLQLTKERKIK